MNCHLNSLCHSVILINGDLRWVQLCQKSCVSEFLNSQDVQNKLQRTGLSTLSITFKSNIAAQKCLQHARVYMYAHTDIQTSEVFPKRLKNCPATFHKKH